MDKFVTLVGAEEVKAAAYRIVGAPSMCARVRALEQAGRLVKTSRRRDGCAVYEVCR